MTITVWRSTRSIGPDASQNPGMAPGRLDLKDLKDDLAPPRGLAIAIERRPSAAVRLHAAERALADPDPAVRDQAIRAAAQIVQAAYREVAGG